MRDADAPGSGKSPACPIDEEFEIIDKRKKYGEDLTLTFSNDTNKPVYPEEYEAQVEAMKNDPMRAAFAASRREKPHDRYAPVYHFSQPTAILNDPNGLCYWQGHWHLFYQHITPLPGNDRTIYWGHAISRDLIHWTDLPEAIYPYPEKECWSGAVCVEGDKVTAVYFGCGGHEGIYACRSTDPLLLNWNKLYPEPVIPNTAYDATERSFGVYDPCIWRQGKYFYMICGCHKANAVDGRWTRVEWLFRSENCVDWQFRRSFIDNDAFMEVRDDGACPYFVPLGGNRHLLMHYSHARGPKYLVGRYDPEQETFTPAFGGRFNHFHCMGLHAPSVAPDGQGGAYAVFCLPGGNMSLPYRLSLGGRSDELRVAPVESMKSLRGRHVHVDGMDLPANQEIVIDEVRGDCMEIVAKFSPEFVSTIELKVFRSPDNDEYTKIGFYRNRGAWVDWENPYSVLSLDATRSTLTPMNEDMEHYVPAPDVEEFRIEKDECPEFRIFLDKSLVEVFFNDRVCICKRIRPSREDSIGFSIEAVGGGGRLLALDAWEMTPIDQTSMEGI